MDQQWIEMFIAIAGFVASVAVVRAQVSDLRSVMREQQMKHEALQDKFHTLPDVYVNLTYFKETIRTIRDDHKELREDVKQILTILQNREL